MSPSSQRGSHRALQSLLLKRFGMAVATYSMVLLLCWVAMLGGLLRVPPSTVLIASGCVALSQFVLFWLFIRDHNLRFSDPSLTEPQVLLALAWNTWLMSMVDSARGTLLAVYVLILLFGVFQLKPPVLARCAAIGFFAFAGLNLYEAHQMQLVDPALALLQVCVLFVLMVWLSLFGSYVQALRQRMRQRRFALQAHQDTLRGMMRQLEDLASTDELTGLYNRRRFLRIAEGDLSRLRKGHQSGLALIDLDHFKRINDIHGHATGDRVLQTFAKVARSCLRDDDVLARYGGEEFVLLLPETDAEQFRACCERLREAFASAEPEDAEIAAGHLSLSIGLTLLNAGDELDAALQRADEALYRAKRAGRNRCEAAWDTCDA